MQKIRVFSVFAPHRIRAASNPNPDFRPNPVPNPNPNSNTTLTLITSVEAFTMSGAKTESQRFEYDDSDLTVSLST